MIIVKLFGGLGNQMCQYAFGKNVATRIGTELLIDRRKLPFKQTSFGTLDFLLQHFNIMAKEAEETDVVTILDINPIKKIINKFSPNYKRQYIIEGKGSYNPQFLNVSDNTYFEGFWHNEKYFRTIRNILLSDLTLKEPFDQQNQKCKEELQQTNSVAVHFRRGDFITNPKMNANHGVCSIEYYKKAFAFIESKIQDVQYFFFSDEPDWVRKNIKKEKAIIVDWNGTKQPQCDLMLMTFAKHNIIANSVFGWWGAWLNQNPNKMVLAPKKWNADPIRQKNAKDRIPKNWIRL